VKPLRSRKACPERSRRDPCTFSLGKDAAGDSLHALEWGGPLLAALSQGVGFHGRVPDGVLYVILGGATLQRCGNRNVLNPALAAEVTLSARELVFPQPVRPCRSEAINTWALQAAEKLRLLHEREGHDFSRATKSLKNVSAL